MTFPHSLWALIASINLHLSLHAFNNLQLLTDNFELFLDFIELYVVTLVENSINHPLKEGSKPVAPDPYAAPHL